jgi:hypothetical protein
MEVEMAAIVAITTDVGLLSHSRPMYEKLSKEKLRGTNTDAHDGASSAERVQPEVRVLRNRPARRSD